MRFHRQRIKEIQCIWSWRTSHYTFIHTCVFFVQALGLFPSCSTSTLLEFFSQDAYMVPKYSSTTFPPVVKEGRMCSTELVVELLAYVTHCICQLMVCGLWSMMCFNLDQWSGATGKRLRVKLNWTKLTPLLHIRIHWSEEACIFFSVLLIRRRHFLFDVCRLNRVRFTLINLSTEFSLNPHYSFSTNVDLLG